jgi:mercuric ion transport protein
MFAKLIEKLGSGGVVFAALSCTACFPALGGIASALGLGFLSHFEGIAINILMPTFAVIGLLGGAFSWFTTQSPTRGLLSVIGPLAILLTLYPFWQYDWSSYLFYAGVSLMIIMSILEIFIPTRRC